MCKCNENMYKCGSCVSVRPFPYCGNLPDIIITPTPSPLPRPVFTPSPTPGARDQTCWITGRVPKGQNPITGAKYPGVTKGVCCGPGAGGGGCENYTIFDPW